MNPENLSEVMTLLTAHNTNSTYQPLKKDKNISVLEAVITVTTTFGQRATKYFQWYFDTSTEKFLYQGVMNI